MVVKGGNIIMNWAVILWFSLMAAFLVVESLTVTVISLWFAGGALAALAAAALGGAFWLQILVFLLVSTVLLASLRPLVRKYITPKVSATNVDAVIGAAALVIVAIDNLTAQGQVKLNGMEWSARSTTGEPIAEGTQVKVDRVEGVKVYVTPAEISESVCV